MQTIVNDLKLIIIGTLLIMFDFYYSSTTNGTGFKIDIINDVIGAFMIYIATTRMSKIEMKNFTYYRLMSFVNIATMVLIFVSIYDFFIFNEPTFMTLIIQCLGIITTIGVLFFFAAMTYFTEEKLLESSFEKMKIARNLIFWIYVLPTFLLAIPIFGNLLFKSSAFSFHYDGGWGILILILFIFVPIFYGLYAILVTRRELRNKYNL
ncbi:hypothetical protein [Kordia jejudonensis]|uniref:hypothetical protein n=1 Tax=Kordia jejudonensis TaxID=1348245 RepID=UPI0006290F52|nr:hypothetical protein [Kordia jejudonensis]